MSEQDLVTGPDWAYITTLLPPDVEQSARRCGAVARCRGIPDAVGLLRMALAYAVTDLSLKDVAGWAASAGVAEITGPGLFYRLRMAEGWLEGLLGQVLHAAVGSAPSGLRWKAVDATVITGPASKGTDWRVHACMDPATGMCTSVEITDVRGGESLGRHDVGPGEVVLGDRAYATARGLDAVRRGGGHVLVRAHPSNIRLCDMDRAPIHLSAREPEVPVLGATTWPVLVPVPPEDKPMHGWRLERATNWIPARAIAGRTRTGSVIWLLTTLADDALSATTALEAYRVRWQIELFFKRLKSQLHMDTLPTRCGPTAKSWMLAKLLAAALAQKLTQPSGPLSPWGYDVLRVRPNTQRLVPVSDRALGAAGGHPRTSPAANGDQ